MNKDFIRLQRHINSLSIWQKFKWTPQAEENMRRWIIFGKAERRNLD